ncbi:NAD-dependent epimerase/dehydratase family protein [Leptospira jelokensis]|uniref:NAD-dependent epimerase/dehydratase family protein n=1 Tax=Leptospira jelokensis TaxID=2484931 RepID=UPI0010912DCC|nr:NAD(P)-dependent oxidoreductase [Leptospira jelokensis]TGM01926.1 NAD(P)-dependent oxidoreductase [Leptospira jelokensis]
MKLKILLLGGSGFIGSHIGNSLLDHNFAVTYAVRKIPEIPSWSKQKPRYIEVDFTKPEGMVNAFRGHDAMVYCISDVDIRKSLQDLNKTHITLAKTIYDSALQAGIKKYLLLSSVEIYGFDNPNYISEDTTPNPSYDFQKSLLQKETLFETWIRKNNLSGVILQPSSTIGSNEKGSSFFYPLFREHKKGSYPLLGRGKAKVSLIDTRDIGNAVVHLVRRNFVENHETKLETYLLKGYDTNWGQVYETISSVRRVESKTWNFPLFAMKLIARLLEIFTPKSRELIISRFGIDLVTKNVLIDDQKLRQTGYLPRYNLRESIESAIDDFENSKVIN